MEKRFNLEDLGLPSDLFDGVFDMEQMENTPVSVFQAEPEVEAQQNGEDIVSTVVETDAEEEEEQEIANFRSVEASRAYWECKPDNYYAVVEFCNVIGDAVNGLNNGDLNLCSRALAFSEQIADQIRMQEAMSGDTDDFDAAVERITQVKGFLLHAQQEIQKAAQQQAQQVQQQQVVQPQQQVVEPAPVQQPQQAVELAQSQLPALATPPHMQFPDAPWKRTAKLIPFVGGVLTAMPDQKTFYDSALNAVLGKNFKQYKGIVSLILAAAAGAGVYYYFIKPKISKKRGVLKNRKNPFLEKRKSKKKKMKRPSRMEFFEDYEEFDDE